MGAYLVLYPRVRVYVFVFLGFFFTTIALPAWTDAPLLVRLQFIGGSRPGRRAGGRGRRLLGRTAGGFVAGVVPAAAKDFRPRRPHSEARRIAAAGTRGALRTPS